MNAFEIIGTVLGSGIAGFLISFWIERRNRKKSRPPVIAELVIGGKVQRKLSAQQFDDLSTMVWNTPFQFAEPWRSSIHPVSENSTGGN